MKRLYNSKKKKTVSGSIKKSNVNYLTIPNNLGSAFNWTTARETEGLRC